MWKFMPARMYTSSGIYVELFSHLYHTSKFVVYKYSYSRGKLDIFFYWTKKRGLISEFVGEVASKGDN